MPLHPSQREEIREKFKQFIKDQGGLYNLKWGESQMISDMNDFYVDLLDQELAKREADLLKKIKEIKDEYGSQENIFNLGLQAMKGDVLALLTPKEQ